MCMEDCVRQEKGLRRTRKIPGIATQGIRVRIAMRASCKQKRMSDTRLKSIKVVAVDDHPDSRALLKMILKLSSADELAVVGSGREAMTAIKKVHPDVLICVWRCLRWTVTHCWRTSAVLKPKLDIWLRSLLRLQIAAKIELRPNELVLQRISSNRSIPMKSSRQS